MSRIAAGTTRLRTRDVSTKRSASTESEAPSRVPLAQRSTTSDNIQALTRVKKAAKTKGPEPVPASTVTTRRSSLRLAAAVPEPTLTSSRSTVPSKAPKPKKNAKPAAGPEALAPTVEEVNGTLVSPEDMNIHLVEAFDAKVMAMSDSKHSSRDVLAFHQAICATSTQKDLVDTTDDWEEEAAGQLAKLRYTNLDQSLCNYDIKALTEENTQINTDVASMPLSTEESTRLHRMARVSTMKKMKVGRLNVPYNVQIIEDNNEQHEVSFYLTEDHVYAEDELEMSNYDDDEEEEEEEEQEEEEGREEEEYRGVGQHRSSHEDTNAHERKSQQQVLIASASNSGNMQNIGKMQNSGLRKPQISLKDMLTPVKAPQEASIVGTGTGAGMGIYRQATPRFPGEGKQQPRLNSEKPHSTPFPDSRTATTQSNGENNGHDQKNLPRGLSTPFYPASMSTMNGHGDNLYEDDDNLFVDTYRAQLSMLEEREKEEETFFKNNYGHAHHLQQKLLDEEEEYDHNVSVSGISGASRVSGASGLVSGSGCEDGETTGIFSSIRQLNYSDDSFDKSGDNSYNHADNTDNMGLFSSFGVKMNTNNIAHALPSTPSSSPSLLPSLPSPKVPSYSSTTTTRELSRSPASAVASRGVIGAVSLNTQMAFTEVDNLLYSTTTNTSTSSSTSSISSATATTASTSDSAAVATSTIALTPLLNKHTVKNDVDDLVQQFLQKSSVARDRSRIEAALERLEAVKHDATAGTPSISASASTSTSTSTSTSASSLSSVAATPFKTRTLSSLLLTPSSNSEVFEALTNPTPVKHHFPTVSTLEMNPTSSSSTSTSSASSSSSGLCAGSSSISSSSSSSSSSSLATSTSSTNALTALQHDIQSVLTSTIITDKNGHLTLKKEVNTTQMQGNKKKMALLALGAAGMAGMAASAGYLGADSAMIETYIRSMGEYMPSEAVQEHYMRQSMEMMVHVRDMAVETANNVQEQATMYMDMLQNTIYSHMHTVVNSENNDNISELAQNDGFLASVTPDMVLNTPITSLFTPTDELSSTHEISGSDDLPNMDAVSITNTIPVTNALPTTNTLPITETHSEEALLDTAGDAAASPITTAEADAQTDSEAVLSVDVKEPVDLVVDEMHVVEEKAEKSPNAAEEEVVDGVDVMDNETIISPVAEVVVDEVVTVADDEIDNLNIDVVKIDNHAERVAVVSAVDENVVENTTEQVNIEENALDSILEKTNDLTSEESPAPAPAPTPVSVSVSASVGVAVEEVVGELVSEAQEVNTIGNEVDGEGVLVDGLVDESIGEDVMDSVSVSASEEGVDALDALLAELMG